VTISNHRKVIKLWDTPRRKVRGSSPCFYTSDSLGTVAPRLIACDKATHNKYHREGLARAAKYSSLVCALEKEMAIHSSILAWRIPGTGEPGGCHLWGHTELDTTEVT